MSAHYFGLLQMVLSEHQVSLPVDSDRMNQWATTVLDVAKSKRGNHAGGQELYLYLRNKFMKCYNIRCGVKL